MAQTQLGPRQVAAGPERLRLRTPAIWRQLLVLIVAGFFQIFLNALEQVDDLVTNREHDRHDRDRDARRDQTLFDGRRAGLVVSEFSQLAGD